MAEVFFYHLDKQPLRTILPQLLEKGLGRGLRMIVETAVAENVEPLSARLWGSEDVAFLAHGHGQDSAGGQPIWLCADAANPNAGTFRFYIEGAMPDSLDGLDRAIILFDSNSEEALANARNQWKKRKEEGHAISYWKQSEDGRWVNLA